MLCSGRRRDVPGRGAFGMRVIFPVGDVASKVHDTGQQTHVSKSFQNKSLHFSPANPFGIVSKPIQKLAVRLTLF